MGLFTKDVKTLDDAFVHSLQTTYYAEKEITAALPKMIAKATAPELKQSLEAHLRETETHVARLEQVFGLQGVDPETLTCPAIDGIIKAGNSLAGDIADAQVLDAALASAAQIVEHYEIAQYGTMIAWARELGRDECATLLAATLREEKAADETLTRLAESRINHQAKSRAT